MDITNASITASIDRKTLESKAIEDLIDARLDAKLSRLNCMNMKLYYWDAVSTLEDCFAAGRAFAIATSLEEAIKAVVDSHYEKESELAKELKEIEPWVVEVDKVQGFAILGKP